MKKNNLLLNVALALSLSATLGLSCAHAEAEGGGDKGNGGNTLNKQLLDLVTNARCDRWVKGADFMKENSHIEKTLSALSKMHWPLAASIRSRIEALDFCMTGQLRIIDLEKRCEGRAPVTMYTHGRVQAAARIDTDVYVDSTVFKSMRTDKDRAYLLIHEAGHDFFPRCSDMRTFRLHTFVKNIEKVESGVIKSREDFIFQMEKNGIDMNFSSSGLDSLRPAIDFLRLDYPAKRKLVLSGAKDLFFMTDKNEKDAATDFCAKDSFSEVCEYTVKRLMAEPANVLRSALVTLDTAVVSTLLNVQLANSLGARAISGAVTTDLNLSETSIQAVIQSAAMKNIMKAFMNMDDKGPVVQASRLYYPATMNHLFADLDKQAIYRASRVAENSEFAPTTKALVAVWSVLLAKDKEEALKNVSYGNPNVITGLSLLGYDAKLKAKAVFEDDYTLSSQSSVRLMQTVFAKIKVSLVQSGIQVEKINQFFSKFNESDLAYKIQE